MEDSLVAAFGPRGARVAAFLAPLCGDDVRAATDVPSGWLIWVADAAGLGPNGPAELLAWREALFPLRRPGPSPRATPAAL